jgi:hypothetical protein
VAVISVIGIALFVNVSFTDRSPQSVSSAVGPLIGLSLYLFYAAVIITIGLSIRGLVKNPEKFKKDLIRFRSYGCSFNCFLPFR